MIKRVYNWCAEHPSLMVALMAMVYYSLMSAKTYTWIFVSGDSGDWLASSTWWMVPQPMGSPLYILLGRFLNVFPGDLVVKMTILLSCLPGAVTVGLVCNIARRLTGRADLGVIAGGVLLGATIYLTQTTILEEYSIAIMFVVLGYWFYLRGQRKWTAVALALGTGVHIVVAPILALWLIVEYREWRKWLVPLGLYALLTAGSYSLILVLMAMESPPLLAGYLNFDSILQYFTGTAGAVIGTGSIFDFPQRLALATGMLVVSLGLCIIPITYALGRPMARTTTLMVTTVCFALWFHLTSLDPVSWTFMCFGVPFMAVLGALGMSKLRMKHVRAVAIGAVALIVINCALMNAGQIAQERPEAGEYYEVIQGLPNGSAVMIYQSRYSLGLFYAMAEGREDLAPIVAFTAETPEKFADYLGWMEEEYGIKGNSTLEMLGSAYGQGRNTYVVGEAWFYDAIDRGMWPDLSTTFNLSRSGSNESWLHEVVGCTGLSSRR